ncbi:MAG: helix-hairpin-helix domain-containing protein [Candidatus Roizmanbacteria bacterium]|nr:MAG: helix-hairpin-helix domain-containing protein [Candidatus Roizmanbacteria bacterium]
MEILKEWLQQFLTKYKIEIVLITLSLIIVAVSVIIYLKESTDFEETKETNLVKRSFTPKADLNKISVYITGSVEKPDVYEVTAKTRLKEILEKAGGLSISADKDFFNRNFNLAQTFNDQDKIYIPSYLEVQLGLFVESPQILRINQIANLPPQQVQDDESAININTASTEELDELPGVGQTTAEKIINNRPYTSIEELLNKKILKKNIYENIKEIISL